MSNAPTDEPLPGAGAIPAPAPPPVGFGPNPALGDLGKRFLAYLIDFGILFAGLLVAELIGQASAILGTMLILVWICAAIGYPFITMCRENEFNGQTLGKQWMGIRVVREDGRPVDAGTTAMREIVARLPNIVTCGIYGLIDVLWCTWDPRRQCIHDKIASTLVLDATVDPRVATQIRV